MSYRQRQHRRRPPSRMDTTRPLGHPHDVPGRDWKREGDWKRLADYVIDARTAAGFPVRRQFADHIHISDKTLQRLELYNEPLRPNNLAAIEHAIGWAPGSWREVLAGGEPTSVADMPPDPAEPDLRDDVERKLWSLAEIPEDHRRTLIHVHRVQLESGQRLQKG